MNRPATIWKPEATRFGGEVWYKVCRIRNDGTWEAAGNYYRMKKDAQTFADELNKEETNGIHKREGDHGSG